MVNIGSVMSMTAILSDIPIGSALDRGVIAHG
jgi:hypothetical protein